ncbi:MAG TPA: ferrous iron transporter B [Planctomycetota bacterium]|nr:ferrous iron transporter B [Planctomycetota bacterium]
MNVLSAPPRPVRVALAGNPNVGKSSLFNALTGLRQRVANYPGVTVERRRGTARRGVAEAQVTDLPGAYSLVPRSPDERVTADVLAGRMAGEPRPDVVVAVVDASQLRRGLFLVSQILDLELPTVVALNMNDEARRAGNPVDAAALSRALDGVPVVETVGVKGAGVDALLEAALDAARRPAADAERLRPGVAPPPGPGTRWDRWRAADPDGANLAETSARYAWAQRVHRDLRLKAETPRRTSDALDRILLHPALGFVIFLAVMAAVFHAVFTLAQPLTDLIDGGVGSVQRLAADAMSEGVLRDLLTQGVIGGVGAVLVFLPQIVILFLLLGVLEDTGYMTRAAFIVDRPLRAIGLSGRSFIPLLSSYACAVPGIMATRTIEDRRERLVAILVAPLTTCSARLPVYALMIGAFVPESATLLGLDARAATLLGLYVAGAMAVSLVAFVLGKTMLRGRREAPILEMPPYRPPALPAIFHRLRHRTSAFLFRAGTVILFATILLWAAAYFPRHEAPPDAPPEAVAAAQLRDSYAGRLGRLIEPAIAPLGFDWKVGIGLIASVAAREVFVSTMGVVYAIGETDGEGGDVRLVEAFRETTDERTGRRIFDPPTVAALLAFYVVAPQCVSTLAVIRRETGRRRWAWFAFGYLLAFAWLAAWATSRVVAAFV